MASLATRPATTRAITHRTRGTRHGPITRLMSPGDLGQLVKPFVFLDLFEADSFTGGVSAHPHSGIATHTTFLRGGMTYADSTGEAGALHDGAVEWMRAGRGVWHTGQPLGGQPILGFQLWLALPPELELSEPESRYLGPETFESEGPVRVLLGRYGGVSGPIELPMPLTYLHVRLADGERWTYTPAAGHDVAWAAVSGGRLGVGDTIAEREMVVFGDGDDAIDVVAHGATEFVLGSAARHPHPLVLGSHSVHTSAAALAEGQRTIAALARTPAVAALLHA
ncbi:pirin family protein [Sphingomonas sp. Leaf343]|uniref:pirin family protein n=1 Tax=Sphingomonas sp. Leaf343 TaxID=1736345 RepID=UPI0006F8E2E1|nr:pirin family protein [Sphingomonas sp. Leaf343]KQR83718.1 pirin [Sphingomonas sp. Leaf343]